MQASLASTNTAAAQSQRLRQQGFRRAHGCCHAVARATSQSEPVVGTDTSRRGALLGLASVGLASLGAAAAPQLATAATPVVEVGSYLPPADGLPGYCLYSPDAKKTPAIRAGVIKPDPDFYQFSLPASWTEAPLLNPLTGNFCMPRCEEPWYEFKFEDPKEGTAQLIVTELQKLGAKPTAPTTDLGPPEQLISRIGNFITGSFVPDDEDVLSAEPKQLPDGRTYYLYEVYTPYSKAGSHNLAAFTTKSGLAYLFTLSATDKQWAAAQGKLRTMLETFRA